MYVDSIETSSEMLLNDEIKQLEVIVKFSPFNNRSNGINYWYRSIQLFIIYGTYSEIPRGKHYVQDLLSASYCITH